MGDFVEVAITGTAQRTAWSERKLPPIEQLAPDLWCIPVPIPNNPLRYVSVYVLGSESSVTLIDAGSDGEQSWQALLDGLCAIGANLSDVGGVLITHQHYDHIGLAKRLRDETGAWIALHPADYEEIRSARFRDPDIGGAAMVDRLVWLGSPRVEALDLVTSEIFEARSNYALPDRLLHDGDEAGAPGWRLRAIHTPGHTPGHLVFIDHDRRRLFGGDHLLPRITPNVSVYRDGDGDALGDYLGSLEKVASLGDVEVLPAHEWRYTGLRARIDQLRLHHQHRSAEMVSVVAAAPGRTAWELAARMTWSRPWDQHDGLMRVSAVTETAAHAVHLVKIGVLSRTRSSGPARFYVSSPSGNCRAVK